MQRAARTVACLTGLGLALLFSACGEETVTTTDNPPTISLSAPNGGVRVDPGGTVTISWSATDDGTIDSVVLSYTADNVTATRIASVTSGATHSWTAPNDTLYGVKVKAVAYDNAGQSAQDESDAIFAIVPASARGYVTSTICKDCHSTQYDELFDSGHPYKLNKVVGGVAPTYPHSSVPDPPTNFQWSDITYVIGGYGWKARFLNDSGFIITDGIDGVNAQYNLPRSDLGGGLPAEWTSYHATDTERKPYDCGACHTTGWQTTAENGGINQDGLPGIAGTWEETGITCEQCHGAGENHVVTQQTADITIDESSELCGSCHFRDVNHNILAKGGFIRHHEQYDELISAGHSPRKCVDCHEPHIGTRYGNAAAGGFVTTCESCHASKTSNSHVTSIDCVQCHMPRASKSARKVHSYEGDVRTHIFAINSSAVPKDSMFFVDQTSGNTHTRPWVTLDFVCYQCHTDPNTGEGGGGSSKTLTELSAKATGIHN